jgi:transcriptional regulator with XRE-family HTH domain
MTTRNRRRKARPTPTMDAVLAVVRERMKDEALLPLSKALGVNRNKLLRLLEGERPAVLADLDQLAQGLGVSITVTVNRRD